MHINPGNLDNCPDDRDGSPVVPIDECPELRDLAAVYSDHPDFDPNWSIR